MLGAFLKECPQCFCGFNSFSVLFILQCMDYKKIYDRLMSDRLKYKPVGYYEKHHIIPKSMGGTDDPSNIVALSARDHFYAHLLLAKVYGGTQWCSVIMMTQKSCLHDRNFAIAARQYERARKNFSLAMKGRKHTPETVALIAAASKGREPWNKGKKTKGHKMYFRRQSQADGSVGWRHTEEAKQKIRAAKLGCTISDKKKALIGSSVKAKNSTPSKREKISACSRYGHAKKRSKLVVARLTVFVLFCHLAATAFSCKSRQGDPALAQAFTE